MRTLAARSLDAGTAERANWNVRLWHNRDLQWACVLGPPTAALPTFGPECRVTDAFQTQGQAVLKVAV